MISSISERTGTIYSAESTSLPFSHSLNVFNPEFSHTQTGEETKIHSDVQPDFVEYLPIENFLRNTTGYELPTSNILLVFFNDVTSQFVTSYRITSFSKKTASEALHQRFSQKLPLPKSFTPTPAARLREISGLDIGTLADIFSVSRATYHKWITNSVPRHIHRKHLLEVLSLIEEAAQRLENPNNVADWLLTPVTSNGTKPIDYLRTQNYSTFRGFLLSVRTGNEVIQPLNSPVLVRSELPREDMEDEIENLSPRASLADEVNLADTEL
ncbi:MAG: hypothetical protein M3Z24_15505 [Chloroflexota bacterium]|nr:hypothetical protein [Chloroflexota bacterium]